MSRELGKRIQAARAYVGLDREALADALGLGPPTLGRIEAGVEPLNAVDRRAVITGVANVTRIPEEFFTVDFSTLVGEETPESTLERLVPLVESLVTKVHILADRLADDVAQRALALRDLEVLEVETSHARQAVKVWLQAGGSQGSVRGSNLSEPELT
jgi:transcriptional regulator with XRE-family HTH domain